MMHDYLSTYLRDAPPVPLPTAEGTSNVFSEYVHTTRPSKPSKLPLEDTDKGFVGFVGTLPYTYSRIYGGRAGAMPEGKGRNRVECARTKSKHPVGRAFAWPHRLGIRRLPMWSVCRAVSSSGAEADRFFAALALADGLPEEYTIEQLRRVSSCSGKAAEIVSEVINAGKKPTPELYAAYCRAHPFAWELGLK